MTVPERNVYGSESSAAVRGVDTEGSAPAIVGATESSSTAREMTPGAAPRQSSMRPRAAQR